MARYARMPVKSFASIVSKWGKDNRALNDIRFDIVSELDQAETQLMSLGRQRGEMSASLRRHIQKLTADYETLTEYKECIDVAIDKLRKSRA